MEYKTTYDYFYNKTYSLGEKMIQNSLIESKKNSRSFAFTLEQINKKNNELIVNNCKIKSSKYLIELEKVFKNKKVHIYLLLKIMLIVISPLNLKKLN